MILGGGKPINGPSGPGTGSPVAQIHGIARIDCAAALAPSGAPIRVVLRLVLRTTIAGPRRNRILQMLLTFRHVLRGLEQQRGYSAAVIVTLALTIGTTTAIFSAVYAILLKPLPITRPDALVICWERAGARGDLYGRRAVVSGVRGVAAP